MTGLTHLASFSFNMFDHSTTLGTCPLGEREREKERDREREGEREWKRRILAKKNNAPRTDGPTDGRTDGWMGGRMDRPSYRDARTHLKTASK